MRGKSRVFLQQIMLRVWHNVLRLLPVHIPIALKLSLTMTVLLVAGMMTLGVFIANNQNQLMREQLDDFGSTVAGQLAALASEPILSEDGLGLRLLTANLGLDDKVLGVGVYARDGQLLSAAGIQPAQEFDLFSATVADHQEWFWHTASRSPQRLKSFMAPAIYKDIVVGSAIVTLSASLMDQAAAKARYAIIYATLAVSVFASLFSYWLSRRLSSPIHSLMRATRAIHRGDLAVRIEDRRNDEIGYLIEGFNTMAAGLLRKSQVEKVFSRYVSKNVADKVLANLDEIRLGSRHVEATVLFVDMVGFTTMSESLKPQQVSDLLNEYFSYISTACTLYCGVVDKFIGDCAMLVFGALEEEDSEHSFDAICCALLIQQLSAQLNEVRRDRGQPEVLFRVGINCGIMLAGNLGSDDRMEYTVVGDAVNLASRLCYVAEPGQIIMRQDIVNKLGIGTRVQAKTEQTLPIRGKSEPVTIYSIQGVHPKYHSLLQANLEETLKQKVTYQVKQIENA